MHVASVAYAAPSAAAYMAARGGTPTSEGVDGRTAPQEASANTKSPNAIPAFEEDPVVGRYPVFALSFNADASKLVLLFRDPATGETMTQIPSEVALKQYEEIQRKEREESKPKLELVIGGSGRTAGTGTASDGAASGAASGAGGSVPQGAASSRPAPASEVGVSTAPGPSQMAFSRSAPAGAAAFGGGGAPHLDLTI